MFAVLLSFPFAGITPACPHPHLTFARHPNRALAHSRVLQGLYS